MAELTIRDIDLIHIFKSGIAQNLSLLEHLPVSHKREALQFWMETTETVKAILNCTEIPLDISRTESPSDQVIDPLVTVSNQPQASLQTSVIVCNQSENMINSSGVTNLSERLVENIGQTEGDTPETVTGSPQQVMSDPSVNPTHNNISKNTACGYGQALNNTQVMQIHDADEVEDSLNTWSPQKDTLQTPQSTDDSQLMLPPVKKSTTSNDSNITEDCPIILNKNVKKKVGITFVDVSENHRITTHNQSLQSEPDMTITPDVLCKLCGNKCSDNVISGEVCLTCKSQDNDQNTDCSSQKSKTIYSKRSFSDENADILVEKEPNNDSEVGNDKTDNVKDKLEEEEIIQSDDNIKQLENLNGELNYNAVQKRRKIYEMSTDRENKKLAKKKSIKLLADGPSHESEKEQSKQNETRRISLRIRKPNRLYSSDSMLLIKKKDYKRIQSSTKSPNSKHLKINDNDIPTISKHGDSSNGTANEISPYEKDSTRLICLNDHTGYAQTITMETVDEEVSMDVLHDNRESDSNVKTTAENDHEKFQRDVTALIEKTVFEDAMKDKSSPNNSKQRFTKLANSGPRSLSKVKGILTASGGYKCEVCQKVLSNLSNLRVHMRQHTGEKPFTCSFCGRTFTTKPNMLRHEATHRGERPYECPECHMCFTEKKSMLVHQRRHTGDKPYKCQVCGKGFRQSGTLQSHMDRHTGYKGFACNHCNKTFRQKSQLAIHVLRHSGIRNFPCVYCEKKFVCKGELERHMNVHSGKRPFVCTLCSKTFTRTQYLREHMNMHTGARPHKCKFCSEAFSDVSSCSRHMHRVHGNDQSTQEPQQAFVVYFDTNNIFQQYGESVENTNMMNTVELQPMTLDQPVTVTMATDDQTTHQVEPVQMADFSAISLLASATEQTDSINITQVQQAESSPIMQMQQ